MESGNSQDLNLSSEESYKQLTLGSVRPLKIPGVARDFHILPIFASNFCHIIFTPGKFISSGFVTTAHYFRPKDVIIVKDKYTLVFDRAQTSHLIEPMYTRLLDTLYPTLLEKLEAFKADEEKAGRRLPPCYQRVLDDGIEGRTKHCKALYSARDGAFVKVEPEAEVYTDSMQGYLQKAPISTFDPLPKLGQYKVRLSIRSILLSTPPANEENKPVVSVSFVVDQLLFAPLGSRVPQALVLDSSDFFIPAPPPPAINEEGFFDKQKQREELLQLAAARATTTSAAPTDEPARKGAKGRKRKQQDEQIDFDALFS